MPEPPSNFVSVSIFKMPAPATLLECPVKYLLTSFFRHPAGGQDHGAGGGARGGGGRGSGGDAEQAGGPPQLEKREALGSHGPPPPTQWS